MHGARRVAARIQVADNTPERRVLYTRYDPGLVLERHAHAGDEVIHIIEGEVMVGGERCEAGTTIVLEKGASFGPLVAGDKGATLFEVFIGPGASTPVPVADPEHERLLKSRGIVPLA